MTLVARVGVGRDRLAVDVAVDAADGEVVALLGPNGAGKTTVLHAVAGLVPLDTGRLEVDGVVYDDPVADRWVPPEGRSVGVAFQDHLLFPHLSVLDNVAFGLRTARRPRRDARRQAGAWLERLGLADLADVAPRRLSGGQSQRVALARALATRPSVLLLDEPLAALDAGSRPRTRRDLRSVLAEVAGVTLLVTHDPVDALTLADRVVVVESGAVVQAGRLDEVTAQPRSAYVADLVGVNLLAGAARGTTVDLDDGGTLVVGDHASGPVFCLVHPRAVSLHDRPPGGSPRNRWPATVAGLDLLGDRVRVRLEGTVPLIAEVTPAAVAELDLREGRAIWTAVKATEVATYPR